MAYDQKRQFDRHRVVVEAAFQNGSERIEAHTRDISLGGAFIETDRALPYGAKFQIELKLPALNTPAVIEATVRWTGADGMGIQWGALRARETWAINQIVKR